MYLCTRATRYTGKYGRQSKHGIEVFTIAGHSAKDGVNCRQTLRSRNIEAILATKRETCV